MNRRSFMTILAGAAVSGAAAMLVGFGRETFEMKDMLAHAAEAGGGTVDKVVKTDEEWRKILSPEQYRILRRKGTERAFTGKYHANHDKGVYVCAGCANPLFGSETKFESGTGWPSFHTPVSDKAVVTETDRGFFMTRIEVLCARCGGHLGHVFNDGPAPTGLRYCMNSAALDFVPA